MYNIQKYNTIKYSENKTLYKYYAFINLKNEYNINELPIFELKNNLKLKLHKNIIIIEQLLLKKQFSKQQHIFKIILFSY